MSELLVPTGSTIIASLHRPEIGMGRMGVVSFQCDQPTPAYVIANGLCGRLNELVSVLPELLLPGPPVSLLLHIVPPGVFTFASALTYQVERATKRDDVAAILFRDMGEFADRCVDRLFIRPEATVVAPSNPAVN